LKHNTVQTNQTNHPQITVHTSKRRQAGRSISIGQVSTGGASGDGSGSRPGSAGSKQRGTEGQAEGWSGASRDQSRRSQQRFRSGRVSKGTDTGPRTNTTPRQSLQVWP
ncbi:unnamed protein product, partial [Staurois parvus]